MDSDEKKLSDHLVRILDNLNEQWHSIQLLLSHVSKPLMVDDRGLKNAIKEINEKLRYTLEKIKNLDLLQTLGEIKYIGKRLNAIEDSLVEIKEKGIRKQVQLEFSCDGYELVKKPLNYDKNETVEKSANEKVMEILKTLSEKESKVLIHRLGLLNNKNKTLDSVGEMFGVTRESIRRVEAIALRKLRHSSIIELVKKCDCEKLKKAVLGRNKKPYLL